MTNSSFQQKNQSDQEKYLASIIDTIHEALLILDNNLRVISANKTFYDQFHASQKDTENKLVYELGNGQWNIPLLKKLLEELLPSHNPFNDFRVEHHFPKIGNRVMLLNARQIREQGAWQDRILLAIEDVTERDRERIEREVSRQRELKVTEELRKSETLFNTLSTLAPVGIFLTDTEGNCLYVNKRWQEIAGLSLKKALGQGWIQALHPEDKTKVFEHWSAATKKNSEFHAEYRFKTKRGQVTWVEGTAVAITDAGRVTGYIGTLSDISDRKAAVEALTESESRFRLLADSSPVLMWVNSLEGCDFVNQAYLQFLGVKPKDVRKYDWAQFIHPDDRDTYVNSYLEAFKAHSTFESQFRFRRADGEYRWMKSIGLPRFDTENTFVGYVGSTIDISDIKELERQKDDFLGIASHELKTPVTSLKAFGQVIQKRLSKAGDVSSVQLLGKMDAQINKLTNLIGDLLDMSRIEGGRLQFHNEAFAFDELVDEIVEEIQRTTERHTLVKKGTTGRTIQGDRDRIGQVLTNFLTNAIKYSPHASKIIITSSADTKEVLLCVKDFGVGIPKQNLPHIFERFYRVTAKSHETIPGMGLGLYISSEIITRQGGRIWAESTKGKGSMFCFTLPLQSAKKVQETNTLATDEMKHE